MSEPRTESGQEAQCSDAGDAAELGFEVVDALPVLADERPLTTRTGVAPVVAQAAAVAATGFVAGAATVALLRRHQTRSATTRSRAPARGSRRRTSPEPLSIVGSRTFLVDVHLLGSRP